MSLVCNDPGVRAKGMIEGAITGTTGTGGTIVASAGTGQIQQTQGSLEEYQPYCSVYFVVDIVDISCFIYSNQFDKY